MKKREPSRKLAWLKYHILRRYIMYHKESPRKKIDELKNICSEIEGKSAIELTALHKKYIGY